MGISVKTELITPAIAEALLAKNGVNRPLDENVVFNMARQMTEGKWLDNGETIIIASEGSLLDGQHRLTAVTLAQISLVFTVARGVDPGVFPTIDSGRSRTFKDVLGMGGKRERGKAHVMASAALWLWKYQHDAVRRSRMRPSNAELEQLILDHPGLERSVDFVLTQIPKIKMLIALGLVAFSHYIFSQTNPVAATEFFLRLQDGVGLDQDSPIYALRERLISRHKWGVKEIGKNAKYALVIKAWNAYISGRTVSLLRFGKKEALPVVLEA